MNKIELMAMGFQKGLKVKLSENAISDFWEMDGDNTHLESIFTIDCIYKSGFIEIIDETGYSMDIDPEDINYLILILRPISDLISEIDHNNEVFVPLYKLVDPKNTEWSKMAAIEYNPFPKIWNHNPYYKVHHDTLGEIISVNPRNILVLPFHLVCKLVEWHFDICGLIEKGEAVDYHTLSDFAF